MAKAIEECGQLKVGHFGLGLYGQAVGSLAQEIHDGDTVTVRALGNFSVRFLGIDTPEISFAFYNRPDTFISTENPAWQTYLSDPFAANLPPFDVPLSSSLLGWLRPRLGAATAPTTRTMPRLPEPRW